MKNVSKLVIVYAMIMFVLTLALTVMLFLERKHLTFDLPTVIAVGVMLLLGYIVSIGLFVYEMTKTEEI